MDNKKTGVLTFAVCALLVVAGIYIVGDSDREDEVTPSESEPTIITLTQTPIPYIPQETKDYSYLVKETSEPNISNMVGYFGNGAFAWYIPGWLVQNWTMETHGEGMIFYPKADVDEGVSLEGIKFTVGTSSEEYNAATIYEEDRKSLLPENLVINEILLNEHQSGALSINMELNTRIYHVQRIFGDLMEDSYYIDGNGKTLTVNFAARKDIFIQLQGKIRAMVEGVGELKSPQG